MVSRLGKISSLLIMPMWLFAVMFSMVMTSAALTIRMGKMASFHNQFHPSCWEMVAERSVSDQRAGNHKLYMDTTLTTLP